MSTKTFFYPLTIPSARNRCMIQQASNTLFLPFTHRCLPDLNPYDPGPFTLIWELSYRRPVRLLGLFWLVFLLINDSSRSVPMYFLFTDCFSLVSNGKVNAVVLCCVAWRVRKCLFFKRYGQSDLDRA